MEFTTIPAADIKATKDKETKSTGAKVGEGLKYTGIAIGVVAGILFLILFAFFTGPGLFYSY